MQWDANRTQATFSMAISTTDTRSTVPEASGYSETPIRLPNGKKCNLATTGSRVKDTTWTITRTVELLNLARGA